MASPEPSFPEREQVVDLGDVELADAAFDAEIDAFLHAVPVHVTPIPAEPRRGRWVAVGALCGFLAYLVWGVVCYAAYQLLGLRFSVLTALVLMVGGGWALWSEERAAGALLSPGHREPPE